MIREVAEGLVTDPTNTEHRAAILKDFLNNYGLLSKTRVLEDTYIASFTTHRDDLSQWRAYGNRGAGYCIGLTMANLVSSTSVHERAVPAAIVRIEYDRDVARTRVRVDLERMFSRLDEYAVSFANVAAKVMSAPPDALDFEDSEAFAHLYEVGIRAALHGAAVSSLRVKNAAFASEQEWRLIARPQDEAPFDTGKVRPTAAGLVPYVEVPLQADGSQLLEIDALIVGPTQDPERGLYAAKRLLRTLGYDAETIDRVVVPSKVPFRG